jgi:hypothetical protein
MKSQKGLRLFLGVLSFALFAGCIQYVVDPNSVTANADDTFVVDVVIDHCWGPLYDHWYCTATDDVYGAGFDLNYDPAVLEYQSIDLTDCVISGATVLTGFRNSGTDNGKLVVGISKSGQVAGEPASGIMASITFKAKAAGTTELSFADPHLVDSTGKFYVGWPIYFASLHKATVTVNP